MRLVFSVFVALLGLLLPADGISQAASSGGNSFQAAVAAKENAPDAGCRARLFGGAAPAQPAAEQPAEEQPAEEGGEAVEEEPPAEEVTPEEVPAEGQEPQAPVAPPVRPRVVAPPTAQPQPRATQPGQPAAAPAPMPSTNLISFNLSGEVDLRVLLAYVSTKTGKRFVYDEKSFTGKEKVFLLMPTKIPEENLFALLESLLAYKGVALVPSVGNIIQVVPGESAPKRPAPLLLPEELFEKYADKDSLVTVVYKIKYASVTDVQTAITPLMSTTGAAVTTVAGGAIIPLAKSNVLIMTDYSNNLIRILKVIQLIDDERIVPKLKIFKLVYANAEALSRQIAQMFRGEAAAGGAARQQQMVYVDSDAATNSIIVVALADNMDRIEKFITELDVKPLEATRNVRFYPLKNAKAEDVEKTLQNLVQQMPSGMRVVPGARQPQPGETAGQLGAATVKIIGDKGTNSIIVYGPPDVQDQMAALIDQLDRRRAQVLIEALVVQVTGSNSIDWGMELNYFGGRSDDGGVAASNVGYSRFDTTTGRTLFGADTTGTLAGQGLTYALINNDQVPFLLRALLVESNGKVISRPRILANDNAKMEDVKFDSLEQQPFAQIQSTAGNPNITSFGQYAEAGTRFAFEPHISESAEGDYVTLKVSVEISQFTSTTSPIEGSPPPKRSDSMKTEMTIPHNFTIVIGGLTGTHNTRDVTKVPILGDIPLLGNLFRRTKITASDTTEYVFLKARVAKDEDFRDLIGLSRESEQRSKAIEESPTGIVPKSESLPGK